MEVDKALGSLSCKDENVIGSLDCNTDSTGATSNSTGNSSLDYLMCESSLKKNRASSFDAIQSESNASEVYLIPEAESLQNILELAVFARAGKEDKTESETDRRIRNIVRSNSSSIEGNWWTAKRSKKRERTLLTRYQARKALALKSPPSAVSLRETSY